MTDTLLRQARRFGNHNTSRVARSLVTLAAITLLGAGTAFAAQPLPAKDVPDALKSWVPWVQHGNELVACPRAGLGEEAATCVWPSRLSVDAGKTGARFRFEVTVYGPSTPVELPGDSQFWPQDVTAGTGRVPVTSLGSRPVVRLAAGTHVLSGVLPWSAMPASVKLPFSVGLLELKVNGKPVQARGEADGVVWLKKEAEATPVAVADALTTRVYRRIDDSVPVRVTTQIQLSVAGKARELVVPAALLDGFTAETLSSPLPARLDANGNLKVQARAGTWAIDVQSYRLAPVQSLAAPASLTAGSREELWSVHLDNQVRLVTLSGLTSVNAEQADVPAPWRTLPAYRVRPGEALKFGETRRGEAPAAPNKLELSRRLWLDFNGAGLTVQDVISGVVNRSSRLELGAPAELGQVSVGQVAQPLTRTENGAAPGVTVRRGTSVVEAVSRVEGDTRTLPAVGWNADFDKVSAVLTLPPGWTLLHAGGPDYESGSWVSNWSLLDFFFVALLALATVKLLGWRKGLLMGAALALTWHLPGAPRWTWLA